MTQFMPAIVKVEGERMLAVSRDERLAIREDGTVEPQMPGPRKPLKWPDILKDDPATKVCEACEHFSVRRDGCPRCAKFPGGCAAGRRYKTAVMKRECPLGLLQHLPVVER